MRYFIPFLFLGILLSIPSCIIAQIGLSPIYSLSNVDKPSSMRTAVLVQNDTLSIPYIEDFSGPYSPILSIDTVHTPGGLIVYMLRHMKMHGLRSGDSIYVFNIRGVGSNVSDQSGIKYIKAQDARTNKESKYSFQLFNDPELTIPTAINSLNVTSLNWKRLGYKGYSTSPDTLGFQYTGANSGGVTINDAMGIHPPSIGVATFDGINYLGKPYEASTSTKSSWVDNLTSLPFNLSSYLPGDSLYMSFFWQKQGLGKLSSPNTAIVLEFKSNSSSNAWKEVWKKTGSEVSLMDTFYAATVAIKDSMYLHKGFQYRFRSYGIQTGQFDIWNIDYIYIDTARTASDLYLADLCIVSSSNSCLKNYTAVPYKHFKALADPQLQVEENQILIIRELAETTDIYNSAISLLSYGNIGDTLLFNTGNVISGNAEKYFTKTLQTKVDPSQMVKPYVHKREFSINNLEAEQTRKYDLSFNNFRLTETYFYDYYAYDDFSAEYSIRTNESGLRIANKYGILKKDTLTHVDICFLRNNGPDQTNIPIFLKIWDTNFNEIHSQKISIQYSSILNGFTRYTIDKTVLLTVDTFYVGFQQFFDEHLFTGYDRNSHYLNNIYFSRGGNTNWESYSTIIKEQGALMIRPVFSNGELLTPVTDPIATNKQFQIYPNPSQGKLFFFGYPELITVYDLNGKFILQDVVFEGTEFTLINLPNGLYILHLSKGKYTEMHKLMIQHDN